MTALKPGDHFALARYTPCDRAGNAGATQSLGPSCRSVEEAKQIGFAFGRSMHPNAALSWKRFSDTTWGLMAGGVYTNVLVSWCTVQPSRVGGKG